MVSESRLPVNELNQNRQTRLKVWLLCNDLTQAELARRTGLTRQAVYAIVHGVRAIPSHIEALASQGVPGELLPDPEFKRRGRPPKQPGVSERA